MLIIFKDQNKQKVTDIPWKKINRNIVNLSIKFDNLVDNRWRLYKMDVVCSIIKEWKI